MPTMVELPCPHFLGLQSFRPNNSPPTGRTLVSGSSAGSRMAFVVRVPKSGQIAKIRFGVGTCTAVQDVKIALMDVTANSNFPDNTDDAYRDEPLAKFVTNSIVESGFLTHDGTDGGTMKTVVAGEPLAITFRWVSATGTLVTFMHHDTSDTPQHQTSLNYTTRWGSGGNWFGSATDCPHFTLIYADGSEESPAWMRGYTNHGVTSHNSGSSPDEYALLWQAGITGLVDRMGAYMLATSGQVEWSIYDEADTVLGRVTTDPRDHAVGNSRGPGWAFFTDRVRIERDAIYRISARPPTVTAISVHHVDFSAGERLTGPWGPIGCMSSRTNDGAWTENITRIPQYLLGFTAVER